MNNVNQHPPAFPGAELLSNPVVVRGQLALLGWPSLSAWAKAHGFSGQHTRYMVTTWGRTRTRGARAPHGGVTLAIAKALTTTLIEQRRPTDIQEG